MGEGRLKRDFYPPGDFTLEELKTLGPTLTSTGWLKKSLLLRDVAYSTSSMERLTLNTDTTTGKATTRYLSPHNGSTLKDNLLGVFFDIDTPLFGNLIL